MTHLKKILVTTAILAFPAMALAQVPTDAVVDTVKDKAVDTVMDNMTTDDAIVAGKTMIKGGSKEDAAMAVVKNRADDKIEGMKDSVSVGGVSLGDAADVDMSKDGMMDAGKDMAKDKMMDEAKGHSSATKYGDKAPSSARTYGSAIIHKSGTPAPAPAATTAPAASTPLMAPVNCPSGTTAQPDGTCMITGNWNG